MFYDLIKLLRSKKQTKLVIEILRAVEKLERDFESDYESRDYIDDNYLHRDVLQDYVDEELRKRAKDLRNCDLPENVTAINTHERYEWAR